MSLSQDPFNAALDYVPKFREFDIAIIHADANPIENTQEFVSTYKAIQTVNPPEPVEMPERASFFDFATISPFEQQVSVSQETCTTSSIFNCLSRNSKFYCCDL